jgi:hypothetical protein
MRWLEYHESEMGIVSKRKPLPLAVGGSVHIGFAHLLAACMDPLLVEDIVNGLAANRLSAIEDKAVGAALADFRTHQAALDAGEEEQAMQVGGIAKEMAETMGTPEALQQLQELVVRARGEFEQFLFEEQSALVEGLVRAYARRRVRALLERYEVLEVEREGSWLLSESKRECASCGAVESAYQRENDLDCLCGGSFCLSTAELWFMSRLDALLRERESNELYILSYKTAAKWDRRKAEDAKRDMQGLSEGVEVEKRLGEWWKIVREFPGKDMVVVGEGVVTGKGKPYAIGVGMTKFLRSCPAPPRILGIRYEYILKGDRWIDKGLSERLGVEARSQRSPLVSAYRNDGMAAGDEQWNVSWDYHKEDGSTSKLYYKNWHAAPVWKSMPVKEWIDRLDAMVETVGEGGPLGWSGPAQATGFLEQHPLEEIFIPPIIQYRNDDELRDWVEQVEAAEIRVAEGVAAVRAAQDEGEKRHLLNVHFPMTRRACEYPTTCQFAVRGGPCYGSDESRRNPLGTGLYKIRTPNHPVEAEGGKGQ